MKKKTHGLLAVLALFVLVFAMSINASAASKTVAKIGSKSYTSLQSAVNAVKKGQTIKLVRNVQGKPVNLKKNVKYTLDLNKKKIGSFNVKKGTVTIKNGKITGSILISGKAKVTLKKCKVPKTSGDDGPNIVVKGKASLKLSGGSYYISELFNEGSGTVTVNNVGGGISWLANKGKGKTVINGAKITTGIYNLNGNMVINDINFIRTRDTNESYVDVTGGTLQILGGTFSLKNKTVDMFSLNNGGTLKISGGTFELSVSDTEWAEMFVTADRYNGAKISTNLLISGGTFRCNTYMIYNGEPLTAKITGGTFIYTGTDSSGKCKFNCQSIEGNGTGSISIGSGAALKGYYLY